MNRIYTSRRIRRCNGPRSTRLASNLSANSMVRRRKHSSSYSTTKGGMAEGDGQGEASAVGYDYSRSGRRLDRPELKANARTYHFRGSDVLHYDSKDEETTWLRVRVHPPRLRAHNTRAKRAQTAPPVDGETAWSPSTIEGEGGELIERSINPSIDRPVDRRIGTASERV